MPLNKTQYELDIVNESFGKSTLAFPYTFPPVVFLLALSYTIQNFNDMQIHSLNYQ